jgi:BCD family chlorophyll transporter-like MFS transporter
MLDMTTAGSVGLFIGAWGMSNALSRLIGSVLAGAVRDIITRFVQDPVIGYITVFFIEAAMLLGSLSLLRRIDTAAFYRQVSPPHLVERAAIANDV